MILNEELHLVFVVGVSQILCEAKDQRLRLECLDTHLTLMLVL
jgi:hypothetical protein